MPKHNIVKNSSDNVAVIPFQFLDGIDVCEENIPSVPTVESEFQKALRQAEDILNTAREQSEKMRSDATELGLKDGFDKGYNDGYIEGYQKAYDDMTTKMNEEYEQASLQIRQTVEVVSVEKNKILERYIDDLKQICLAVAEKIIQTSLKSSGEVIKRMILTATEKLKKTQWAKIYISKKDSELLVEADAYFLSELAHISDNLRVVAMDNEEHGTCIVELPQEIIDVSVNTQLENIKDILNNARL